MSATSFVLFLNRFINLFGIPECIYSDNARSFVAGCNIVKKYLTSAEFQDRVLSLNIGDNVKSVNLKKGDGSNYTHSIKHLYRVESFSVTSDIEDFDRSYGKGPRQKRTQMSLVFDISLLEIN